MITLLFRQIKGRNEHLHHARQQGPVEAHFAHGITVTDGKISRFRELTDTAAAVEAIVAWRFDKTAQERPKYGNATLYLFRVKP